VGLNAELEKLRQAEHWLRAGTGPQWQAAWEHVNWVCDTATGELRDEAARLIVKYCPSAFECLDCGSANVAAVPLGGE
jgi:hypothetical protein